MTWIQMDKEFARVAGELWNGHDLPELPGAVESIAWWAAKEKEMRPAVNRWIDEWLRGRWIEIDFSPLAPPPGWQYFAAQRFVHARRLTALASVAPHLAMPPSPALQTELLVGLWPRTFAVSWLESVEGFLVAAAQGRRAARSSSPN